MKTQRSTNQSWDRAAIVTCLAIMLMALMVLVGWHTHVRAAVQIFHGLVPMQYNTALCFLLLGAAGVGLITGRRLLLFGGGSLATLMGGVVILEYASGISFGIDTLFFYPWDNTLSANPGRMAITTAISFFLTGSALIILALRQNAYAIFGIVNSVPLSLALTSLIGYIFQITYLLPFTLGSQMALQTSAAFLAYGIVMLGYAWKRAERGPDGVPKWGAAIGVALLPVLLVGISALFPEQSLRVLLLETLFSILGIALITLAVQTLSQAKMAYKGLVMIAMPMILLLIFVGLVVRVKHQSESAQLWALHSQDVIGVSQSLLAQAAEAESAVRAYVITRDVGFLSSYESSREALTQTTKQLRSLVSDSPLQEASVRRVEQLVAQRMDHLSQIVGAMKTGENKQAEELVKSRRGADLMKLLRTEMGIFLKEEERLAAERRQILDTSWQRLSWLLVAGAAAAILLASILTLLFSGSVSSRLRQLRDNAINLAGNRELAPPLTGHDEIAELDRVFHEMANSLDEVTRREKAVIEGSTDGIFVKDLEQRYLMVNQAGADPFGKTAAEVVGASDEDLFAPETAKWILERDNEILASGQTATYEIMATTKAGVKRTYLATKGPYRDRNGNIVGLVGITRDITEQKLAEEALATSEKRYRHLVDSGQGLICTHDLDGNLLSVNPAAAELLGYTPVEMVGRNLVEYVTPAVREIFPNYLQLVASEPKVNGLLHLLTRDGAERIWMFFNSRIGEPGGTTYVLGFAQDVTDSKRAEEELRTLTQRLSLATRVGNIGVWDWDIQSNTINWDERMFEIYGIAPGTTIDYNLWKAAVLPEDVAVAETSFQRTITQKSQEVAEFRILMADGSERHVQTAQGVVLDRTGKVARVIGLNRDITERTQLENTLRQERIFLRTLIDNIPESVYVKDRSGRKLIANLAEVRHSGRQSEAEVLGKHDFELYPRELADAFVADDEIVLKTGQPRVNREEFVFDNQGQKRWLLTTKIPLRDENDQVVGLIGLGRDITQHKLIEVELEEARDSALESVRLKSEFLANMSHEIRTPMNGVIGMTGLLLETDLSSAQREYTETIQFSSEALLKIIDDILDFSKIDAGLLRFEKIDFELRGVVEATVEIVAERAQTKGLELASLVYQDVPTALRGDPGRLRQVLANLTGNAVKFTDEGEVVVSVKRVAETATHATLRFAIKDTGIGISPETQRGLFHAFTQADGSTTRKYGGTGLGLAISKQLVELMGGEIGIESAPGAGATFWFTARFEKQVTAATTLPETTGDLTGARILIVDDNATNRNILKHQTSSWGLIAQEAESGEQALELLRAAVARSEPYDIAVLDLMMPGMDGFQLAEAIKADPSIAAVALVLLPSFGNRGHGEKARRAGIVGYLQKPVRQSQLYNCLNAVMQIPGTAPAAESQLVTQHSLREAEAKQKDKTFSTARIIIAEDNLVNQKVALGQLYNLGYSAEAVSNGRQLLKALEKADFDLILMDCQMPEMDGFAATAEIRRREGSVRHTTIVAMTANALEGDDEKCFAAGMDDYLSKPVKPEALRLKLERWTGSGKSDSSLSEGNGHAQQPRDGVIDLSQLDSLRQIQQPGATDFISELIDLFVNEAVAQLKLLREAVADSDATGIMRVAHCLRGSSANMGATQMAAISEKLENKDPAKDTGELLVQLESEFELVRVALEAQRK